MVPAPGEALPHAAADDRDERIDATDLVGVARLDRARAVGEQRHLAGVWHDVAGLRRGKRPLGEAGLVRVVVLVVAVRLAADSHVEDAEDVGVAHHDVPTVPGVRQAQEAGLLRFLERLAGLGVEQREALVVREEHARVDGGGLLLVAADGRRRGGR